MSERLRYLLTIETKPDSERDRIDSLTAAARMPGPAAAALGAPRARDGVMTDTLERAEEELSWAGLAVAETLRAVELAAIAVLALLICPPLLILAVVVIVPAIAVAAVVGVLALPVLAVRHFHRHRAAHVHRHYVARALTKLGMRKRAAI